MSPNVPAAGDCPLTLFTVSRAAAWVERWQWSHGRLFHSARPMKSSHSTVRYNNMLLLNIADQSLRIMSSTMGRLRDGKYV